MSLKEQFERIAGKGVDFRGIPLWSWNDKLDPDELARQVHEMARAGLGGHFMHARKGLITEYMGPEWIQCIRAAIAASKAAGIKAWLYDEDGWPSGSAGGVVPALGEDYVAKRLRWERIAPMGFKPHRRTIATFLLTAQAKGPPGVQQVEPANAARKAREGDELLHFFYEASDSYTDLLNPAAVKAFLRHTYQVYRKAVGREFGKTIPGVFTDEPQWRCMPWSTKLPEFFKSLKGHALEPLLPSLALDVGDFRAARYDFWHAATALFVASYTEQIGKWCEGRGLALTGHLMAEDGFRSQIEFVGAAMPHYEHMHIPGIDHLGRGIGRPLLCKQVSSVAHQFGRRALSEMFGGAGWNVGFDELRWIAEWQFVLGVDLVCPHLSLTSARGCRKRDYPPSLHYQQPWWHDYRLLNDYFARLTFMLTRGRHVADVLVLHNIESGWVEYDPEDATAVDRRNAELTAVAEALLGMHVDFDFADEGILARHARVEKGVLRVRRCAYPVVVIPPSLTLRGSTLDILERFIERGGAVVLAGPAPPLMDGRRSARPAEVLRRAKRAAPTAKGLKAALASRVPPRVGVLDARRRDVTHVYVQQREVTNHLVTFLVNVSPDKGVKATVRLLGKGRLERWDPETGEAVPLHARTRGRFVETDLKFEPRGSHLLVLSRRRRPVKVRSRPPRPFKRIRLNDSWHIERTEPNVLAIDTCAFRVGDDAWSGPLHVLEVQEQLRHVGGAKPCELKYAFQADFARKLPQSFHLVVEAPGLYDIRMNDVPLGNEQPEVEIDIGWWRDVSFHRLDVLDHLKPQDRNEIVLRRTVAGEPERRRLMALPETPPEEKNRLRYGAEIEPVHLVGEFLAHSRSGFEGPDPRTVRTAGGFVLTDDWHQATTGDLVPQGLPFYTGGVYLSQTVAVPEKALRAAKGAVLELETPAAVVTKVRVNGRLAAARGWPPYACEVGPFLAPGRNDITIELTGSCRNLFGPHHHADGEPDWVAPDSFDPVGLRAAAGGSRWSDAYTFVRFGLSSPVTLSLWK